jgi:hypothetical protein
MAEGRVRVTDMGLETRVPADDIGQLHQSGIFDAAWYANQYADVAMSGMDPAEHYLWIGRRLGRKPGPAGGLADTVAARPAQPVRAKGKVDLGWNDLPIHPDRPNRWVHNTAAIARNRAQILQPLTRSFNPTSLNIHWIVPDFGPGGGGHMSIFHGPLSGNIRPSPDDLDPEPQRQPERAAGMGAYSRVVSTD